MSSLEAEEALLKRKLEDTDNLEERREIRKQLRELRNKKFEEEIKKVSATDYRPGRDRSALSNGVDSSLGSIGRKASVNKDDEEDTYGINHLETEEELQALLNETPFTETDKRKKIRARIRDIRNHKLGLGELVVIKRPGRSTTLDDSEKENLPKARSSEPEPVKTADEPTSSSRSSYRSRYAEPEISSVKSKPGRDTDSYSRKDSYGRKNSYERKDSYGSRRANRYEMDQDETTKAAKEPKTEVEVTKPNVEDAKQDDIEEEEEDEEEEVNDDDMKEESVDERQEVDAEDDYVSEENVEEDQATLDESEPVNGYDESIDEEEQKKYDDDDDQVKKKRGYSNDGEDEEMGADQEEDIEDGEEYSESEEEADSKKKFQEVEEDDVPEDEYSDVEDDRSGDDESPRKERSGSEQLSGSDQRERVDSAEAEDEDYSEEEEPEEVQRGSERQQEEEYSDEGDYSESEDGSTYSKEDSKQAQPPSKGARVQQDYSDDYSEGYSDNTPTDDGSSSVGGKRYEDDQDLEEYDLERRSSQGNHHKQRSGVSYSAKVEEVFKQKDPRLAEGKDFKDLLKKSDNKPQATRTQVAGKKGPEQVDFRTVLRAADKPKKFGEKGAGGPEQVDFRNMLQKKVKTKTLADKDLSAEQVDFRTVLAKPGAPPVQREKKTSVPRKTSAAEQLDFRNVLKKQPSVTSKLSRKLSVDDKNEMIRNLRNKKPTTVDQVKESTSSKSGRPSLDALRQDGKLEKAKEDLHRNRAESTGSESGGAERKSSRPSLDALKQSGDLGKTQDKKDKFEEMEKTAKKVPVPVPPKPTKKPARKVIHEEEVEPEITNEEEAEPEVEPEPEVNISKKSDVKSSKKSDVQQKTERKISVESKVTVEKKNTEKPRSRRVVRAEEEAKTENKTENKTETKSRPKSEPKREEKRSEKLASPEPDDRKASLKSSDKRARHRRLRQDQNETVKDVVKKTEVNDVEKEVEVRKKSSSIERVAVVQSTASRPTVQVILSTNRRSSKDQGDDSDDEEIGVRRNRRRLLRKGSIEEEETTTHVSVTTTGPPIEEKKGTERKEKRGSSTGSGNADETDGKPTRSAARRQAEHSTEVKKESSKVEVKSSTDDPAKAKKEKMAGLDAKLAARRRQRAMENRDKQQKTRNVRKAFKDQLESNAPTTNGGASPSVQRANSNMTKLLHWCQRMTDGYPSVEVTNFTTSWSDGLAFCALLHNYVPDKIPFGDLSAKRPKENFEIAFSSAAEEGVPELLEVEDMVRMESPDPKSVITYLHSIYQVFVADRR
eukprot:Seg2699.1 transcript_id=Seg2699.1/GoldUCD/mRNA.D3Y31 product=Cytospin-A protein_id=Seg2699.1/GoldUCD/D3Y31